MKAFAVIPARYGSTRFPGKPLALIQGKPMIQWVYEGATRCRALAGVAVATDDDRIAEAVRAFGGRVEMTRENHQSGTERVAEVAERVDADVFVNLQGDEPLMESETIERALELMRQGQFDITSAVTPLRDLGELESRTVVKALMDVNSRALYFSRFPIPYSRSTPPTHASQLVPWRHLGLYVYKKATLQLLTQLPPSPIEAGECLEQLRAMQFGMSIGLAIAESQSFGIDTPEDLARLEAILNSPR